MPKIATKSVEMKDADVRIIALVDRAASRLPFRILKKEKEMLDLSKLTTTKKAEETATPVAEIMAVFVFKQETPEEMEKVKAAITASGFSVENPLPVEGSENVLAFAQKSEEPLKDTILVRMNDQIALAVKGFQPQHPDMEKADFSGDAAAKGFYPSIDRSLDTLFNKLCTTLHSAADQADAAKQIAALCDGFKSYAVDLVKKLPAAAFKMEGAVLRALEEVEVAKAERIEAAAKAEKSTMGKPEDMDDDEWDALSDEDKEAACTNAKKKEQSKMQKPDGMEDKEWDALSDAEKEQAVAKKAAKPVEEKPAVKLEDVMAAITAVSTSVSTLDNRIGEVVSKQAEIENKVDAVAKKAEDVNQLVTSTVTAPAPPADNMPGSVAKGEVVETHTGVVDSAMVARRKKYEKL